MRLLARYLGKDDLNTGEFYQIKIDEENNSVEVYGAKSRILKYKNKRELKEDWERLE